MKVLGRNGIVRDRVILGTAVALSAGLGACGESGDAQGQGGATGKPGKKTTRQQRRIETTGQQAAANIDWDAVGQAIGNEVDNLGLRRVIGSGE